MGKYNKVTLTIGLISESIMCAAGKVGHGITMFSGAPLHLPVSRWLCHHQVSHCDLCSSVRCCSSAACQCVVEKQKANLQQKSCYWRENSHRVNVAVQYLFCFNLVLLERRLLWGKATAAFQLTSARFWPLFILRVSSRPWRHFYWVWSCFGTGQTGYFWSRTVFTLLTLW